MRRCHDVFFIMTPGFVFVGNNNAVNLLCNALTDAV